MVFDARKLGAVPAEESVNKEQGLKVSSGFDARKMGAVPVEEGQQEGGGIIDAALDKATKFVGQGLQHSPGVVGQVAGSLLAGTNDNQEDPSYRTWGEAAQDTGAAVAKGGVEFARGANEVSRYTPAGRIQGLMLGDGEPSAQDTLERDYLAPASEYWQDAKSAGLQEQERLVHDANGFLGTMGAAADNPGVIMSVVSEQALPTMLQMGLSAKAAQGLTAAFSAKAASGTATAFEGAQAAGAAGVDVRGFMQEVPIETLRESPDFQALEQEHGEAAAREVMADRLAPIAASIAGASTMLISKYLGDGSRIAGLVVGDGQKGVVAGARRVGGEILSEGIQEPAEGAATDFAKSMVDDSINPLDIAERGSDAALGMMAGGGQAAGIEIGRAGMSRIRNENGAGQEGAVDAPAMAEQMDVLNGTETEVTEEQAGDQQLTSLDDILRAHGIEPSQAPAWRRKEPPRDPNLLDELKSQHGRSAQEARQQAEQEQPVGLRPLKDIMRDHGATPGEAPEWKAPTETPAQTPRKTLLDKLRETHGRSAQQAAGTGEPEYRGPSQIMQERGLSLGGANELEASRPLSTVQRLVEENRARRQEQARREGEVAPYSDVLQQLERESAGRKKDGVDIDRDDILTAVSKLGGLDPDQLGGEVDVATMRQMSRVGRPVVRGKGQGQTMDHMAESLSQEGFTAPDGGPLDPNSLAELLDSASRGERVFASASNRDSMVDPDGEIARRWFNGDASKVSNALRKYIEGQPLTANQQGAVDDITDYLRGNDGSIYRERDMAAAQGMDPLSGELPKWYGEIGDMDPAEMASLAEDAADASIAAAVDDGDMEWDEALEHGQSRALLDASEYSSPAQGASLEGVDTLIADHMLKAARAGASNAEIAAVIDGANGSRMAAVGGLIALEQGMDPADSEPLAAIDWRYERMMGAEPAGENDGQTPPASAYQDSADGSGSNQERGLSPDRPSPEGRSVEAEPEPEESSPPLTEPGAQSTEAPADAGASSSGEQEGLDQDKESPSNAADKRADGLKWKKDGKRIWRGDNGMIITDESMTVGGERIKSFFVYANDAERGRGNNFATGKSYAEAKRLAEIGPDLELRQQTEESLARQEKAKREADWKRIEEEKKAEERRQADSEAKDFRLSGSDRAADVAAAGGQADIFGAQPEAKRTQAKPDSESYEQRLAKRRTEIEAANSKADVDSILAEHRDDPDGHLEGYSRLESAASQRKSEIDNPPKQGLVESASSRAEAEGILERMQQEEPDSTFVIERERGGFGETFDVVRKPGPTASNESASLADKFAASMRKMAAEFEGVFGEKSLIPLAQDLAEHAIKTNAARLTAEELTEMASKHGVPEAVVAEIARKPFATEGLRGAAQRGDKGARALRDRLRREASEKAKSKPAKARSLNEAASEADANPSDGQKEAGNYKKGHIRFQGLDITIENARGSVRSGTSPDGTEWESEMAHHYGYIKRTEGADGDHVDVFIGPDADSGRVFVIDQIDENGNFDEHKVMLGFPNQQAAREGYRANYDKSWKVGPTTAMSMDEFKAWLANDDTTKPIQAKAVATPKKDAKATAPEHSAQHDDLEGVSPEELTQMVQAFAEAGQITADEEVTKVFAAPKKSEIVRLNDKVKVYHKDHGWMTPDEAKKVVAEWKENARKQGVENRSQNAGKVVLSFFDYTGSWSKPWEEAGYQVWRFDIQTDPEVGDINNFSTDFFNDWFGSFDGNDVYAILAACPCTDFASSGARHFAAKDADGRTIKSIRLVRKTLAAIEYFKPAVWALENPVGRIEKLGGLPPWRLSFDPNHLGENYTKKTLIWGRFNADLPIAPTEPTEGSKMHSKYGGKSIATKNARSETPEGFSYGFFQANNAVDNPVLAIGNKYDQLDPKVVKQAVDAGMTEQDISEVVDDYYYQDMDFDAANADLREAAKGWEKEEPETVAQSRPIEAVGAYGDDSLDLRRAQDKMQSIERELTAEDIAGMPLSKIWPSKEVDAIEDKAMAAFATAVRSMIPSKPRQKYRVKRWVATVQMARDLMQVYMEHGPAVMAKLAANPNLKPVHDLIQVMGELDRGDWKRVDGISVHPDAYNFDDDGNKVPAAFGMAKVDGKRITVHGAKAATDLLPSIREALGAEQKPAASNMKFTIRGREGFYFIHKEGDPEYRHLKTFTNVSAARDYRRDKHAELVAEWEAVKKRDNVRKADVRQKSNRERVGADHRNGRDVTVEEFHGTFGLRHVDWGNWVSDKNGERQGHLNRAYDAFMDLAAITGIPPKAIGLNGDLIITFGKRGSGNASAHFEAGQQVINLTKTNGAGSLAHEWFHALDNYFQRSRDNAVAPNTREGSFVTYSPETHYVHKTRGNRIPAERFEQALRGDRMAGIYVQNPDDWVKVEGVRPEVEAALAKLVETLDSSPMRGRARAIDQGKSDGYWSRIIERAARSFENYVIAKMQESGEHNDYLANVTSIERFHRNPERYPYLLDSEIEPVKEAFDNLFRTIEAKETDSGTALYSMAEAKPEGLDRRSRSILGDDNLLAAWTALATDDDAFQLPVSDATTIEGVFDDTQWGDKALQVRRFSVLDDGNTKTWIIHQVEPDGSRTLQPNGRARTATFYDDGRRVWLDVSEWGEGGGGSHLYSRLANYAHNTGKVFIGDPVGLSDIGMARRLENMISSALKFGTTDHLAPHDRQIQGSNGVPPLNWKPGNFAHNLREMLKASMTAAERQFPEISNLQYNPDKDAFEDVNTGEVWDAEDFDSAATRNREISAAANAGVGGQPGRSGPSGPVTTGGKTLERAVVGLTILRSESEAGSGKGRVGRRILARFGSVGSKRLTGPDNAVLYSNTTKARPSAGLSASGLKETLGRILGKQLADSVDVVQSNAELPAGTVPLSSLGDRIEGMYHPESGKVYLVADGVVSEERAAWVAWHELWHRGIRSIDGKPGKLPGSVEGDALNQAINRAGLNKTVKDLADAIMRDRGMTASQRRVAVEEALADLNAADETGDYSAIERRYGVKVPAGMRSGIRGHLARFLSSVRAVLRKLGISRNVVLDHEVFGIITSAREGYHGNASNVQRAQVSEAEADDYRPAQGDLFTQAPEKTKREILKARVRAEMVETGSMLVGQLKGSSAIGVAHMLRPISNFAQEVFVVVPMDANGNPLGMLRASKGTIDAAAVYPGAIAGDLVMMGADSYWVAHNHPSGMANPSGADYAITAKLDSLVAPLGIKMNGHVVIGDDHFASFQSGDGDGSAQLLPFSEEKEQLEPVRIYERMIVERNPESKMDTITSPDEVYSTLHKLGIDPKKEAGVLLLDNKHGPLAVHPFDGGDPVKAMVSETGKRDLVRASAQANAAAAIVYGGGKHSFHPVSKALESLEIRLLDNIYSDDSGNWMSSAGQGVMDDRSSYLGSSAAITRTPAFRRWFADSKVVDGAGQPLVVYHATGEDFTAFDKGQLGSNTGWENANLGFFFIADEAVARQFGEETGSSKNVMPVYLSIQKPLQLSALEVFTSAEQAPTIYEVMTGERLDPQGALDALNEEVGLGELEDLMSAIATDEGKAILVRDGFDGVFSDFGDGSTEYVAFEPEQVKSATNNDGGFDPSNPDIRFSIAEDGRPETEAGSRQRKFLKGILSQPIDRMFRLPFDALGMIDSRGRLKGGVSIDNSARNILTSWKPSPEGRFGWMDGILESARAGLLDRYGLSDEYKQRWREAESEIRRRLGEASDLFSTTLAGMTISEAKVLQSILTGEQIAEGDWAAVSEPVRRAIDEMGQEAVRLGLITAESYNRNKGKYLHRSYLKHETQFTGLSRFANNLSSKARRRIQGDSLKARGIDAKVSMSEIKRSVPTEWWRSKTEEGQADKSLVGTQFVLLEKLAPIGEGVDTLEGIEEGGPRKRKVLDRHYWPADKPLPAKYEAWENRGAWEVRGTRGGNLVLWRDYTKAERERMGEIVDARYNIVKTFETLSHDLAMGNFFSDVAKNAAWFQRNEPVGGPDGEPVIVDASEAGRLATFAGVDWVKVPATSVGGAEGAKKWGAMAGGYVRAEIWRDLNELDKMHASGTWRAILNQWKLNKTVRSPVVHMNNVMSNLMFMDLADVRVTDLVAGIHAYVTDSEEYKDALVYGAFEANFAKQELNRKILQPILDELVAQNLRDNDPKSSLAVLSKLGYSIARQLKRFDNALVSAYEIEDEVFRMATFLRRRAMGDTVQEAAAAAREQFLDYDIRAPWVNAARRTVLPFISYTYRAVPVVAQSILHRPWKLAKYYTIAYMANMLAYSLAPGDEEEERRTMQENQQGYTWLGVPRMVRMPWRDEHGNPVFLDARRWVPAGDVFDTNVGNTAVPVPAPLQWGGPLMLGAELALNKVAFTGKPITDPQTDSTGDMAEKVASWAWKSWMPSAAYIPGSWYWDKTWKAVEGGRDIMGRPYSVGQALASSVGVKVQPHDVQLGYAFRSFDLKDGERTLRYQARRLAGDKQRGLISEEVFKREIRHIEEKMRRIEQKARELQGMD